MVSFWVFFIVKTWESSILNSWALLPLPPGTNLVRDCHVAGGGDPFRGFPRHNRWFHHEERVGSRFFVLNGREARERNTLTVYNIFFGFPGGEASLTAEGVLYHDLHFEKACNMDFEIGGFTRVFVFFLKGSRVVFQPSFFHWRTNSFRGKSIVKIVTPVDMCLIQTSLCDRKFIERMPLSRFFQVYNRIVPSLKLTWRKTRDWNPFFRNPANTSYQKNPTASLHLKSGAWKMNFLFGVRGELLVFGGCISFSSCVVTALVSFSASIFVESIIEARAGKEKEEREVWKMGHKESKCFE